MQGLGAGKGLGRGWEGAGKLLDTSKGEKRFKINKLRAMAGKLGRGAVWWSRFFPIYIEPEKSI